MEIKLDDPRLEDLKFEDEYDITMYLKVASWYLRKADISFSVKSLITGPKSLKPSSKLWACLIVLKRMRA